MKRLSTGYEWALLLPALLPLFYAQGTMYPLLAPKIFALRAIGIVTLALFAYLAASGHPFFWSRLRVRGAWIPATLLALAYLASALGTDFYHSFWSTFERGDGLLTLTVCVGYFYLLLLSAEREWLSRLLKLAGLAGSLAAIYLVFQWIEVSSGLNLPFIVQPNGRIGGTMGNAAFLAAYLGMTFFAALAAAREYKGWSRRALYVGAALQTFAIVLTATRGTMLALAAALVAFLAYSALKEPSPAQEKNGALRAARPSLTPFFPYASSGLARLALASLVIVGGIFFTFRGALVNVPFEPVARIASISLADPTVSSRLFVWRNVLGEALKRPLLGYGAEHVDVPFDRVYDPSAMAEEWFDRSHNAYLDYFVQFGAGGLLLYLALVALLARAGWRLRSEGVGHGIFILGIVFVYAVQNFFVFDTAMTLWFLLALVALALARLSGGEEKREVLQLIGKPSPLAGALVGVAILYIVIPIAIRPLQANMLSFEAYQYQIVDVPRAKAATDAALALGTYADLELGYNAYFMYSGEQTRRLSGGGLRAAHENAVALLAHNFERYPYDARTVVYLAQVLSLVPPGASADGGLLSRALESAIRLSPKRAQPWYILANLSIGQANEHPPKSSERAAGYAAAQDILTKYIATVPTISTPCFVLAQLLYASGDAERAAAEAAKGKEYYSDNLEAARRAAAYYETVLDLSNAAFFLREVIRLDPGNTAAAEDLATIEAYESKK